MNGFLRTHKAPELPALPSRVTAREAMRREARAEMLGTVLDYPPLTDLGRWTWIDNTTPSPKGIPRCLVRCECGAEHAVVRPLLVSGRSRGCRSCAAKRAHERARAEKNAAKLPNEIIILRELEK